MSIRDVEHQQRAVRLLQYALGANRLPHAYIFCGPPGVGRELCARRVADLLLCEAPSRRIHPARANGAVDACGECPACEMSRLDTHPDLHVIHRELNKHHPDAMVRSRKGIGLSIDVIRHFVINRVATRPALGNAKVFIIRDAETMTPQAQNALLKTLEEPPPTTFVILIAASLEALLPTVRSRCQTVPFGLLPSAFIVERLVAMNDGITEEQARFCALHADGSLGVAQRHYQDGLMEYDRRVAEVVCGLGAQSATELARRMVDDAKALGEVYQERDPEISKTEMQRRGLKALLGLLAGGLRGVLHVCVGGDADRGGAYGELSERLGRLGATEAIRAIATTERQLDLNANVQLCVEGLLIRLSRLIVNR